MGPKARAPKAQTSRTEGRAGRADPSRPPDNPQMGSRSGDGVPRHHSATPVVEVPSLAARKKATPGPKGPSAAEELPLEYGSASPGGQPVADSYVSVPPVLTEPVSSGSTYPSPFEQIRRLPVDKGKEREIDPGSRRHPASSPTSHRRQAKIAAERI